MKSRAFFPETLAKDIRRLPTNVAFRAATVCVRAIMLGATEQQIREYLQRKYIKSNAVARVRGQ